ncbi:nuclear transport factor 2 family protein [Halosimplex aquaticum]|uniref:Nuclear transport factor 2 family protein n=1 Tax=Halosimplex aquaticum TaxID=3026162 RepID=A0ABD5Y993_9EURY|nr:nuclear transport factor 2 family protein [Halosimplex aquaticum]
MGAADRVRAYYDALRAGEPLAPFFAPGDDVVKVGISERLVGGEEVAAGLREQTESTTGWHVESRDLRVTERDRHAWFADSVAMAWTDTDRQIRYEFDTRWSGTLERRIGDEPAESSETATSADGTADERWQFVGMHVSTARDLG